MIGVGRARVVSLLGVLFLFFFVKNYQIVYFYV